MFFLLIINELNEIHNIRTKFLNLVLLNICRFEAILCRNVYKVRVYFDSLSLNKIYLDELFFFYVNGGRNNKYLGVRHSWSYKQWAKTVGLECPIQPRV